MKPTFNSFIKENKNFLMKVQSLTDFPYNTILGSLEVLSLYVNIPHEYIGNLSIYQGPQKPEIQLLPTTDLVLFIFEIPNKNTFDLANNTTTKSWHNNGYTDATLLC